MLEIAIMIEGQNGLTWPRWQRMARVVEDAGFVGLYRSDHFTNANPPDEESLELWTSLAWLASHTRRIEFGPLVTPFSFRHPALTVRMAVAVDDLSDGRLTLGLGAGWQDREHHLFGFDLLDPMSRFDRFEEGVQVVTQLLKSDSPVSLEGRYYHIRGATLLPRPQRPSGPRILIGGTGKNRTLPLAARYADEWNSVSITPDEFRSLNARMNDLLKGEGRDLSSVRRSMMTNCQFAATDSALKQKLQARGSTIAQLRKQGTIVGTGNEVEEQLQELAEGGLQRIMLQWLDLDDLNGVEALAKAVL